MRSGNGNRSCTNLSGYRMNPLESLTDPIILHSRPEVLSKPSPVPNERGLYAWFFKEIPNIIPTNECVTNKKLTLLYVGISPKNNTSKANLRKRITFHHRGNAEGSTLRQTLGVILTEQSGYPLRRVGSGKRMTLTHLGEQWLDAWMKENAFVCWIEHPEPWTVEAELLQKLSLPLNIQDNQHHPFCVELRRLRADAKAQARSEGIANEGNQRRRGTA
jgi:hypothetical protein